MKRSMIALFCSYLRRGSGMILLAVIFSFVSLCVFLLYDLPLEGLGYTLLLCLVIGLLYALVGFVRYVRRIRSIPERAVAGRRLPETQDALELTYQEFIETVRTEKEKAVLAADLSYQELVEYYTMWAHQIKTPIAGMRLLLQSEEHARSAQLSAELFRIEQYVEMVLSYLRIDSPTNDLVFKTCSVEEIVRRAVRKYSILFIQNRLKIELSGLEHAVLTDEKWLQFVVEQLLSNAIKYTPVGGRISITCTPEQVLVIEDTGIGIGEEDLPRVFERGYTGYNGRTGRKSTGIGLYLCKKIIAKLGYTIALESEPGKYTRARIDLSSVQALDQLKD